MAWGLWLVEVGGRPVEQWLQDYDPDYPAAEALALPELDTKWVSHPVGLISTTSDPSRAKSFVSVSEALMEWKRVSAPPHAVRSDGEPNRPLSAFTVTPQQLPERSSQ